MGHSNTVIARIFACLVLSLAVLSSEAVAATVYRVRLNTSEFSATARHLALDWIAPGTPLNSASVGAFVTDGKRGRSVVQGGPVSGGLVDGGGPLAATLRDSSFQNQLVILLDSTGTSVAFDAGTSENVAVGEQVPEQLSFFFLNPDQTFPFPSVDPLGANALFVIDVTGQSGGNLSVFAPMEFVPPDTIRMTNSTTGVDLDGRLAGRLRFVSASPNPSRGSVRLVYDVPEPGGWLRVRVYDVAGRLVAEPFLGRRTPGTWTTQWNAGRDVPAGVYIVHLQMAGQSLVRLVALTR